MLHQKLIEKNRRRKRSINTLKVNKLLLHLVYLLKHFIVVEVSSEEPAAVVKPSSQQTLPSAPTDDLRYG